MLKNLGRREQWTPKDRRGRLVRYQWRLFVSSAPDRLRTERKRSAPAVKIDREPATERLARELRRRCVPQASLEKGL